MKNLKDTITTALGLLIALTGAVYTLTQIGVEMPHALVTVSTVVGVVAASLIGFLSGKNPDLTTKTKDQIAAQLNPNEQPK